MPITVRRHLNHNRVESHPSDRDDTSVTKQKQPADTLDELPNWCSGRSKNVCVKMTRTSLTRSTPSLLNRIWIAKDVSFSITTWQAATKQT